MEKEFVPYELALRLKALGFDEPCSAVYFGNGENELFTFNPSIAKETTIRMVELGHIPCPTFSQVFRWVEDNYKLYPAVVIDQTSYPKYAFEIASFFGNPKRLAEQEWGWNEMILSINLYRTRTEAEIACLDKLIEIVEGIKYQK